MPSNLLSMCASAENWRFWMRERSKSRLCGKQPIALPPYTPTLFGSAADWQTPPAGPLGISVWRTPLRKAKGDPARPSALRLARPALFASGASTARL